MASWDAQFFKKTPLFWPIARAASLYAELDRWPEPADLNRSFVGTPPVLFEPSAPKPRQKRLSLDARYDARITLAGRVPTRKGVWHDLTNALVWSTFPSAKAALHARQHRLIAAQLGPDGKLPGARTKEQDAVAMLDEGGVVVLCERPFVDELQRALDADPRLAPWPMSQALPILFGHALYEALATTPPPALRGAAHLVPVERLPTDRAEQLLLADQALTALFLRGEPISRADFVSLIVDQRLAPVKPHERTAERA